MNEERLNAFEKMLSDILAQYDSVTEKLAALKAEGKEKTVTYRQLFTNKLQYQTICKKFNLIIPHISFPHAHIHWCHWCEICRYV